MKIHPVGAELFHADGQTDRTKLIVAFLNSSNAPKNEGLIRSWDLIHLLTAIGLSPGGSTHLHTNNT